MMTFTMLGVGLFLYLSAHALMGVRKFHGPIDLWGGWLQAARSHGERMSKAKSRSLECHLVVAIESEKGLACQGLHLGLVGGVVNGLSGSSNCLFCLVGRDYNQTVEAHLRWESLKVLYLYFNSLH